MGDYLKEWWYWLVGTECPVAGCKPRLYGWKSHACRGTVKEQINATTEMVRKYFQDRPANKNTLEVLRLCDALDQQAG